MSDRLIEMTTCAPQSPSATPGVTRIQVQGKTVAVPSARIQNQTVVVTGRWIRVASLHDENTIEPGSIQSLGVFARGLGQARLRADVFTFAERMFHSPPRFSGHVEWENAAAIPITTYQEWLEKRAATDVKQNVKKSGKRGVTVRSVQFDDELVKGIVSIFNESPVRQGRRFWHYGKDFATVKKEISHCLERSEFIGAYCQGELIGFIKLLCVGGIADIVSIVSKQSHHDRRPTNALIAKAVEVCAQKGMAYLTYARFTYGKKSNSSLAEFKRRNGFEQINFPRYYLPLTIKGRIAVKLRLYRGITGMLPESVLGMLLNMRGRLVNVATRLKSSPKPGVAQAG